MPGNATPWNSAAWLISPGTEPVPDSTADKVRLSRRAFQQWLAAATTGMALPAWVPAALGMAPSAEEATQALGNVHPELRAAVAGLAAEARDTPPLSLATLPKRREGMGRWTRPLRTDIAVEEHRIPRMGDDGAVRVFAVNSKAGASRPAILHTHGGGYILGEAKGELRRLQDLSASLDCTIVTVDYRLAPEVRFEGSIEDNYAGLKWLHANATALGVDRQRIALLGESAGGGHAALLAITARDRAEVPVCFQCLIYPMLDDRTGSTRAVAPPIGTLVWTAADNRFGWQALLGAEPGSASVPTRGVPARTATLAGLPPAFIGVGALDLFVDEDIDYARRLIDVGVATELVVVPGAFHGFDLIGADTSVGSQFSAAKLAALRRAFATIS